MSFETRKALIDKIQKKRGSKLLTYFLADREVVPKGMNPVPGIKLQISQDAKVVIHNVLRHSGISENLDLFIFTRGGDTNAVWPIVSLLREFSKNFEVLIPFRCHSAGTMICLGADRITMTKIGELSPIDPTTGNPYNPVDELMPRSRKGISVEDLTSYIDLARTKFNLKQNTILEVFKELTRTVQPLALGNVNRVHTQIRLLAKKLLSLHLKDEKRIEEITNILTEKFYSHLHFISRAEAMEILGKDIVIAPDDELDTMILNLFDLYAADLKLWQDFCYNTEMGTENTKTFEIFGSIIENEEVSYIHKAEFQMSQRSEIPPNFQIQVQPGQGIPRIIPGLPKLFSWDVSCESWIKNERGV